MADPKIDVIFGASIAGLIAGVEEAKASIQSLVAPVQEFQESLGGITEAIGAAFAVEKIRDFIVEMGEAGERALNMSAAVGTSVEKYSLLSTMIALAGGNAETAGRTLERLSNNISMALAEPTSRAARAFESLGISMETLRTHGNDLLYMVELMAKKFVEFQNSTQKTADFYATFGRGFDQLAGFLREAGINFDELRQEAEDTGAVLTSDVAAAMARTGHETNTLSQAVVGLGRSAFMALHEQVNLLVGSLIRMTEEMSKDIREGGVLHSTIQGLAAMFTGWVIAIEAVGSALESAFTIAKGVIEAAKDAAVGFYNALMAIPRALPTWLGGGGAGLSAVTEPLTSGLIKAGGALKKGGEDAADILDKSFNGFIDDLAKNQAEWLVRPAKLPGEGGEPPPPLAGRGGRGRAARDEKGEDFSGGVSREEMFRQQEQAYSMMGSIDEAYRKKFESDMQSMVKTHQLSKQQEIGFEIQYAAQLHAQQRATLEELIQDNSLEEKDKARLYLQMMELDAKYEAQVAQLNEKILADTSQTWKKIGDQISQSLTSSIMGVIKGTETIGQAFKKMFSQIAQDLLSSNLKNLFESILGGGSAAGSGGGIFGGLLSGVFGKIVEGTLFASIFTQGGIVPAAAAGWVVPSFQSGGILAQLHSNEMVLPSHISQGFQDMFARGGGGGGTVNIHAWDTQTGAAALMANKGAVAQAWRAGGLGGGLSPRSIASTGRYP